MHSLPSLGPGPIEKRFERECRSPSLRLPLARLMQLLMLLQSERYPNARRLAEVCAVSRRTIYRDLGILDAAGITVLYHPDHQGYQLRRDCWLQPTQLEDREALALLLMSRIVGADDPFGLLRYARSGLSKILQVLPGEPRGRVVRTGELIPDDAAAVAVPLERQVIYETILTALLQRRKLRVLYQEVEPEGTFSTDLGVYRIAREREHWDLVGHSSLHNQVRIFRVPWIVGLEILTESYMIPPRFRLERFLARSPHNGFRVLKHEVQLRFAPRVAPAIYDTPRPREQRMCAGPAGQLDLFLSVDELDELAFWVLGFGDQVEVLKPPELRDAVRDWAEKIARIHASHEA